MEDMKLAQDVPTTWQGYHNPLPIPTRLTSTYNVGPSPLVGPTPNGVSIDSLHLISSRPDMSGMERKASTSADRPDLQRQSSFPTLKRSWQSFEEGQCGSGPQAPEMHDASVDKGERPKPTIHPDHRLLSFGPTQCRHPIFDQYGRPAAMEITAQIHGMFFLSEIATNAGDGVIIQPELTCYRRNLFQVSGSVAGPAGPLSVLTERGQTVPVVSQELTISATESVDGHSIRLIVIPWKTPPPNSPEVPPNQEQEPQPIPLFHQPDGTQELNSEVLVHPIAWRRLQFRVATANNGRRKELQQHFVLRLSINTTLADGTRLYIADAVTAPIVVRGRSPRNFQARKEIPLIGSAASARGQTSHTAAVERDVAVAQLNEKLRRGEQQNPELLKRPYHLEGPGYGASSVGLRQDPMNFSHWATSTQPLSAVAAPAFSTPGGYTPGHGFPPPLGGIDYTKQMQYQTMPQKNPTRLGPPLPYSSYAHGLDNNPRPAKSPRHSGAGMPMYHSFDDRTSTGTTTPSHGPTQQQQGSTQQQQQQQPSRAYYSEAPLQPDPWATADHGSGMYKFGAGLGHVGGASSGSMTGGGGGAGGVDVGDVSMPPPMPQLYTVPSQGQTQVKGEVGGHVGGHGTGQSGGQQGFHDWSAT